MEVAEFIIEGRGGYLSRAAKEFRQKVFGKRSAADLIVGESASRSRPKREGGRCSQ